MLFFCSHYKCIMMLKIVSKLHSPHMLEMKFVQQMKRRPTESTGVVPAKYSPNVKLENFRNSRVPELV